MNRQEFPHINESVELWHLFAEEIPAYMNEIAVSLLPIILFFYYFSDYFS